jgi:uncharacterized protein (DUF952 family)
MAANPENWGRLAGPGVALNGRGHAQLRLEAIDTLETHFRNTHQPLALAEKALESLLQELGITGLHTDALRTVATAANDSVEGYILSREVEKNHRPVAFAFSGASPLADGASIYLTPEMLSKSVNYHQLVTGMAYPTYYTGLFADLRAVCSKGVLQARKSKHGVWAKDRTNTGFDADDLKAITDRHVILPKLFRRLVEYRQGGGNELAGFKQFLAAKAERILICSNCHLTHFDTIIAVDGVTAQMTESPEDIVFLSE